MRSLGLWIIAVCVGLSVFFPFSAAALITVGALDTPGTARDIVVEGALAYVAVQTRLGDFAESSLRIVDISNPAAPVELGALGDIPDVARGVAVAGGLAYVAVGNTRSFPFPSAFGSLRVIDVSNPAAPIEVGAIDTPSAALDVAVVDGLAYVASGDSGLRIIDFGPEYLGALSVNVDIKPGSDPNSINPSLERDLPVALLGSDSFDVADVDVTTLSFGPSGASFDHSHGPHFGDLNADGRHGLMSRARHTDLPSPIRARA